MSEPSTVTNPVGVEETPSCPVCAHAVADHDGLGIRFCAATADRHLERNCICAGVQTAGQHYARY